MSVRLVTYLLAFNIGCTSTARAISGIWNKLIQMKQRDKKTDSLP